MIIDNLKFSTIKISEYLKELEQIKGFKSNSYNRRKKQLKLMIKRYNQIINNIK